VIVRGPLGVGDALAVPGGRLVLRTTGDGAGANCPNAAIPMTAAARIATNAARIRIARR